MFPNVSQTDDELPSSPECYRNKLLLTKSKDVLLSMEMF